MSLPTDVLASIFPFLLAKEATLLKQSNRYFNTTGCLRHAWNKKWKSQSPNLFQTPHIAFLEFSASMFSPDFTIVTVFRNITSVYAGCNELDSMLSILAQHHSSRLEHLSLNGQDFSQFNVSEEKKAMFASSLKQFSHLQTLKLCNFNGLYSESKYGWEYLSNSTLAQTLTKLDLGLDYSLRNSRAWINEAVLHLCKFSHLKRLSLDSRNLFETTNTALISALPQLEN
jgi:hypothetical protein